MAAYLDMTPGALMLRYIGQGLRQNLATYFQEQALWAVQDALEKRLDRVAAEVLLAEVRAEFQGPPLRPRVHAAGD